MEGQEGCRWRWGGEKKSGAVTPPPPQEKESEEKKPSQQDGDGDEHSSVVKDFPEKGYQIRPSGIHGWGLFATKVFQAKEKIVDYTGTDLDQAAVEALIADDPEHGTDYVLEYKKGHFIDGSGTTEDPGSFVNDARSRKGNNAKFVFYSRLGNPGKAGGSVYFVATKKISPDTEICAAYGRSYWATRRAMKASERAD